MTTYSSFNWAKISTLFIPCQDGLCKRRYDLDWLRVIVFGLLIFYHTGMFYVENWGWHAKSIYQSQFLENLMLVVEPWRMPVLWLISGIAIRFIMVKVSVWRFIAMRSYRLLLPLLFGILVVVPPQLYVEMTYNGDLNMNYWQFLNEFFSTNTTTFDKYSSGIWPHIDVNHLWFIRSLWQYSLVILCMLPLLNMQWVNRAVNSLFCLPGMVAIALVTLPLFIIQIGWEMSDARYPLGFTLMIYGYLIGWNPLFWQRITKNINVLIVAAFICYSTLIIFYNLFWLDALTGNESNNSAVLILGMFNYSLMRVLGVLVVFALAHKFLNVKSKKLSYFNDAVYPFYILHQTFILVIGYHLTSLALGPIAEPLLLIALTTFSCFVGYEIIRRSDILRPLFGLKLSRKYGIKIQRVGYVAALLLTLPIGLKLIL